MKMEILDKIAQAMFVLKAYPESHEIEAVASKLVRTHPCLMEPGTGTGYHGWTISIKFKLGNYRSKLHRAGCNEVSVNRKRREKDGDKEFNRVTTKELLRTFRAALDEYSPRLLKLYRARTGALGQEMENLLDKLDEQVD
ncbi:hypothetical protein AAFF_G00119200 [Aldrovandia affinis]|uniref:Uncharacterized protein n=1 Tax=Aldrovandia affinis TaxID=143900 RepID=A0AAD7RSU0_9TELE|nr:hypothetical protein AAFF_G00119200 [Aldrovandia affinis]